MNPDTSKLINTILEIVLASFPQQGIWHLAGLLMAKDRKRSVIGNQIFERAIIRIIDNQGSKSNHPNNKTKSTIKGQKDEISSNKLSIHNSSDDSNHDIILLKEAKLLFHEFIQLAGYIPENARLKRIEWSLKDNIQLTRFMIPVQETLHYEACKIKITATSMYNNNHSSHLNHKNDTSHGNGNDDNQINRMQFLKIDKSVSIFNSKEKPKIVKVLTTCGKIVKFLCKRERSGDLRVDARMMDFNTVINRVLRDDYEGKRRNLHVRTYAVTCLNEDCGLLEWMENTNTFRNLLVETQSLIDPTVYKPLLHTQQFFDWFTRVQKDHYLEPEVRFKFFLRTKKNVSD